MTERQLRTFLETTIHGKLQQHVSRAAILDLAGNPPPRPLGNGTVSYVNTGRERLLITNSHVYAEFLSLRRYNPCVVLCLFGTGMVEPFDISNVELLDNGRHHVDLAVMRAANPEFAEELNKAYYLSQCWPPKRAEVGEYAICVGFPSQYSKVVENVAYSSARSVIAPVSGSYHDKFVIRADEHRFRRVDLNPANPKEGDMMHGGMSGSAVYLFNPGTRKLRLGGFVYQASDGLQGSLAVLHADYILETGKLDAALIL